MALINGLILSSNYEIIRDRIGVILSDELSNQKALAQQVVPPTQETTDMIRDIPSKIWAERFNPVGINDQTLISVASGAVPLDDMQGREIQNSDGKFFIIVSCTAKAETQNGEIVTNDQIAMFKVARLLRLCRSILMSNHYKTLGWNTREENIACVGRVSAKNMTFSHPYTDTQNDSQSYATGYFELDVKYTETVEPIEPSVVGGYDTTAIPNESENGYFWSIENE